MVVIKTDVKAFEIRNVIGFRFFNKLLWRNALFCRIKHNWRAVSIIGTHKMHFIATHTLETHPNIRLDMLKHMTQMNRPVRIRQSTGH